MLSKEYNESTRDSLDSNGEKMEMMLMLISVNSSISPQI